MHFIPKNSNPQIGKMSQEVLTIKASFNEDIRRFSVDPNINFSSLTNLVHQLFHLNDKTSYYLVYIDNEDDWIKISTDVELEEAKRFTLKSENTTLRLQVKKNKKIYLIQITPHL